jgi:hypothetical protein
MQIFNRRRGKRLLIGLCSFILALVCHFAVIGSLQRADAQEAISPSPLNSPAAPSVLPSATVAPSATVTPAPIAPAAVPGVTPAPIAPAAPTPAVSPTPTVNSTPLIPASHEDVADATVTLLNIDLVRGELEGSLKFDPKGIYRGGGPGFPSRDLVLRVNSLDRQDNKILLGVDKPMTLPSIKWSMVGKTNNYPFDQHTARVFVGLTPTFANEPRDPYQLPFVPLVPQFVADIPGFEVTYTPTSTPTPKAAVDNANLFILTNVVASRSLPVKLFAGIVVVIMWMLSFLVLLVARRIVKLGKQPDVGTLAWMGILLFAFPAIRNSQPGVPPIGILSDFLSFFWAETIVAIALMILAVHWLRLHTPSDRSR